MSAQWKLDQQYADVMSNHPYGIALYRPITRSIFNPGSCGYFDDFGAWNTIAHLEDDEVLLQKGLRKVDAKLEKARVDSGIKWGPLKSSAVRETKVELSGGIDPVLGIPVTVSAVYSYSIDKDVGAVLLTNPPITHERYYDASVNAQFKEWCKKNALAILQGWPEVKRHGLWVVISTYATKNCSIKMWNSRGKGFKVGFDADVAGFGKAGPSAEWHRSQKDEGWAEYTTEGDDRSVVFFGGLKFQYTWRIGRDLKQMVGSGPLLRLRSPRGEDLEEQPEIITVVPDPEDENASFVVDCEEYLSEEEDPKEE